MAIPSLTEQGLLPQGVHDCTYADLAATFGRFCETDRRVRLTKSLREYLQDVRSAAIAIALLVDGSYVTAKPQPEDIDLILILPEDFDHAAELRPFEYNIVANSVVKRKFGFDVFAERAGSDRLKRRIDNFSEVKGQPGLRKGLLRIRFE